MGDLASHGGGLLAGAGDEARPQRRVRVDRATGEREVGRGAWAHHCGQRDGATPRTEQAEGDPGGGERARRRTDPEIARQREVEAATPNGPSMAATVAPS